MLALRVRLFWALEICLTFRVASPIVPHIYTEDWDNTSISTTWAFDVFICHFFSYHHSVATIFVTFFLSKRTLSMRPEPFQHIWVQFMASSHFHLWHNNNLLLHIIWLLIAWLVPILNANNIFFTIAMVHRCPSPHLPFNLDLSFKAFSLLCSPSQAILKSHYILNQH
jgi:hypothetical protein